ncbi:DNA topoisomerase IV subunit A [bacterium]|nr:DNA topoisomerase IV subunit A [bacterium]NBX72184.1 DNA topoisomerase IV subunit A [bacterium]
MIKDATLSSYTQEAYRDYAMYVLLDRALPRLGDGFKPVQRRIVYAMHELGLSATSKPKKSARTIGDVLGKYHPHSDQACYEALVGLAQGFSTRYPIIEGQGNFGSLDDPKSFAAMRYTEVRLSNYAQLLLDELTSSNVPWQLNFDGTCSEPIVLPAKVPFLLLNGCSGIAVGMSTEIPPHNLEELIQALIYTIDHTQPDLDALLEIMPGPDFPTGGIIRATALELKEFYEKGKGSFVVQAHITQDDKTLIIHQIPYYTTVSRIIEQLQQINSVKTITAPFELIDESDERNPVHLVLHFKSAAVASASLALLYEKTELQRTYRCYFNGLNADNVPTCFSLVTYLKEWLVFRTDCLRKQFIERTQSIERRIKIIHACMVVFQNLKQILQIIQDEDEPWAEIAGRFDLDQEQIDALAALRLRQLTKLSYVELKKELEDLLEEQENLHTLLGSSTKLKNYIKNQLKTIIKGFSDKRRTQILPHEEKKVLYFAETKKEEIKPLTVFLSELGWIKTAKGHALPHDHASFRQGDQLRASQECYSNQNCAFIDNKGRFYALTAELLPSSRFGEHASTVFNIPSGHQVMSCLSLEHSIFILTNKGFGFILETHDLALNKRGKNIVKLEADETLIWVCNLKGPYILLMNDDKKIGILRVSDIPIRRSGRGLQLVKQAHFIKIQSLNDTSIIEAELIDGKKVTLDKKDFMISRGNMLKKLPRKAADLSNLNIL